MVAEGGSLKKLGEIVEPFLANLFLRLADMLSIMEGHRGVGSISSADREFALPLIMLAGRLATKLELVASAASAEKLLNLVNKADCRYEQVAPLIHELKGRLLDETAKRQFFSLSLKETAYYTEPTKEWEAIIGRFPDTVSDIEEAAKCYALSRYAAAVFHSIQVVEAGLIALGTFIGVADPRSGWTAVTSRLSRIVKADHKTLSRFEQDNFVFLEQIQGTTEALKNAWRNKVSHVQGKLVLLTADFSPEIAEEIIFSTRAFMRRLAEGLPS